MSFLAINIREQFNDCMDEILKQMECGGNLSGKEGDHGELEKFVRDINKEKQEEIDQVMVDRDKAVVLARDLHNIEENVIALSIRGLAASGAKRPVVYHKLGNKRINDNGSEGSEESSATKSNYLKRPASKTSLLESLAEKLISLPSAM